MAIAVCEMAKKLEEADADKYLIPMVSILLKNNSTEVICSLISNLGPVVEKISRNSIFEKLIPTLTTLCSDKTWRIRLAVVEFIVTLATYIDKAQFKEMLQDVIVKMLQDSVFAIREESINTLIKLSQ